MEDKSSLETDSPFQDSCSNEDAALQIKAEQLKIIKKWIQTGEVKIYRESYTQKKNFTVPVKREELVIEKKDLFSPAPANLAAPEIIRILLGEEQVAFTKHWVDLEDVSVYKRQIEDINHIELTLKHEVPTIKFTDI